MAKLLVATTNPGKLREYRDLLAELCISWYSLTDAGLADVEVAETGDSFLANALLKAQEYSRRAGMPALADDSGLVVDALGGAPGIHSAHYAPTTAERNAKLLSALQGVAESARTARFVCVVACVLPQSDGDVILAAEGQIEGRIGFAPRGTNGFGYDPLFVLPDGRTMAELSPDQKNSISHRGRAMAKLAPLLRCALG